MSSDAKAHHDLSAQLDDCWNRVGVKGDGSCPELEAAVHCRNCPVFSAAGQRLFQGEPPAEYVEERTKRLAQQQEADGGEELAVIIFRIAQEWLGLDVRVLVEVAEPRVVRRIPHRSNRLLLGIVNIRGELLPCIALAELLGIESTEKAGPNKAGPNRAGTEQASAETGKQRLLVTEHNQQRSVLVVDELAGVRRVAADTVTEAPATVMKAPDHLSRGVFPCSGANVGYLSDDLLFRALERSIG